MKSVLKAAPVAAAMLLVAGAASAADYMGTPKQNNGQHYIEWAYDVSSCKSESGGQLRVGDRVDVVIDGVNEQGSIVSTSYGVYTELYFDYGLTYLPIQSARLQNGRDYVTCGADRLLFPGAASQSPAAIPTLTEWAMILLGMMLAGGAALTIYRRRAGQEQA